MKTEKKKVGTNPKYKENVETITLHALIPKETKQDCLRAIDRIVNMYKF